jgi:capsid protein
MNATATITGLFARLWRGATGRGTAARGSGPGMVRATYDAARTSDEFRNYWANADALDADAANSRAVRARLVQRSRYEAANNGYVDGILQTQANYLVGTGPALRMQTDDLELNQAVETQWYRWSKAVLLRRKLWCMAHAKTQDGEALAIARTNPRVAHPVKLDLVLIETEQCQTPRLPYGQVGYIDGIRFDEFGNPLWYDILPAHPGGLFAHLAYAQEPLRVPARYVLHWFAMRRPGQHRGVPELKSTLNVGAASRRMREATVASAEAVARMGAVVLKTQLPPDDAEALEPMSTVELPKGCMTALPGGWEALQLEPKQPIATYAEFLATQISEHARPLGMPRNMAACDSSQYNFASGRLDHLTYFQGIDIQRQDANDLVLDPLFALWWEEAANVFLWPTELPAHDWDWPRHPVADVEAAARAAEIRLRTGMSYPSKLYAEEGRDFEDEVRKLAQDYGIDEGLARRNLLNALLNDKGQQASMLNALRQMASGE